MVKKKKLDTSSRIGGFLFLITILAIFAVGVIAFLSNILILSKTTYSAQNLVGWCLGFVFGFILLSGPALTRLRTFIHESKHAIVVVLTGNKLKEFKAEDGTGHITFELYKDKMGFAPAITLAPYYFPLCSLPLFLLALFLGDSRPMLFSFGLGLATSLDVMSGISEIHPKQSDLQRIIGGFLVAGSFIGGFMFTWVNVCMLWILSGTSGFVLAMRIGAIIIEKIIHLR